MWNFYGSALDSRWENTGPFGTSILSIKPGIHGRKDTSIWNLYCQRMHVLFERLYYHPGIRACRIQVHLEPPFPAWNSRAENKDPCRTSPCNSRPENTGPFGTFFNQDGMHRRIVRILRKLILSLELTGENSIPCGTFFSQLTFHGRRK